MPDEKSMPDYEAAGIGVRKFIRSHDARLLVAAVRQIAGP
jgi:hypothetical protein